MKSRFFDILILLLTAGFLLFGFNAAEIKAPKDSLRLEQPVGNWSFVTETGYIVKETRPGDQVCNLLPMSEPCHGAYFGRFYLSEESRNKLDQSGAVLGLYIPTIVGATQFIVNQTPLNIPSHRFNSLGGILIPIDPDLLLTKTSIEIEIPIQNERKSLVGMFIEAPILGDFVDLTYYRDSRVSYLQTVPFVFGILYFIILILFLWIKYRFNILIQTRNEFTIYFFYTSIFHFFLSGTLRFWFPYWARVFQIPICVLTSYGCFRLIGSFSGLAPQRIRIFFWVYFLSSAVSLLCNILGFEKFQFILYFLSCALVLYPVIRLGKGLKSNQEYSIVFIVAALFTISYVSDSIKILSRTLYPFAYPIRFTTRYISPLLLLATLVYLIYQVLNEKQRQARKSALEELALQVAHDIRSPLAVITAVDSDLSLLPEDTKLMLRGAISRIRDIANSLLEKYRESKNSIIQKTEMADSSADVQLLSSVLSALISEKRAQYKSRVRISIDWQMTREAYLLFAKVHVGVFKSVFSNLIDNSMEALDDIGNVTLSLASQGNCIEVCCIDNGRGIPPEVIGKLGYRGETFGKYKGSGLGLYHARRAVEGWNGSVRIESESGKGTKVVITLPKAKPPAWFLPEIALHSHSTVMMIDDDRSVHQAWIGRFQKLGLDNHGIQCEHLFTSEEFKSHVKSYPVDSRPTLYLVDHDLREANETGLDLIEKLGVSSSSILVTSSFEQQNVIDRCQKLGVKLVPKSMVPFVPISIR